MQLNLQIVSALAAALAFVGPTRVMGQVTTYGQDAVPESRFATEPFDQGYGMDKVPMEHSASRNASRDYGQDANMSGRIESEQPIEPAPSDNPPAGSDSGEPDSE